MLRYKLTGDEDFVQYAMDIADSFLPPKYGDWGKAGDYMLAMILVYDWLYDHLKMNDASEHDGVHTRKQAYLNWLVFLRMTAIPTETSTTHLNTNGPIK